MAYSPAPTSPMGGGGPLSLSNALYARNRAASPQPVAKQDKRRNAMQDRLHDLTLSFSQNRDAQFRQQLHALQCDMTLINNADLYSPSPLPDSADDIAQLIDTTMGGGKFGREMASLSGMWFSKFVQEVNSMKEERDAELTMLMHRHHNNLERFEREFIFREHFAAEEHKQLAATLRERLVQTLSNKKGRLTREKEQLDIADTNALLLHPNQFSITNPASPGGIHGNRKTRHTRHRVDLDEFGNGIGADFNKRKRKADDEIGSPVRDGGHSTPADRAKLYVAQQQNAPAYSIQSLFTDKELSLHANQAHIATVHFLSTSKRADQPSGSATNGNNTDVDEGSGTGDGTGQEDNGTPATDMVRTASHNYHATRSTRTQGNFALNALADLSDKPAVRPNLPYGILASYNPKPNNGLTNPPPLMNEEIDDDTARMERLNSKPAGWIDRSLIELVAAPPREDLDGIPQNPDRFSLLHPHFPTEMGVHLYPAKHNDSAEMLGTGHRSKKTKTG